MVRTFAGASAIALLAAASAAAMPPGVEIGKDRSQVFATVPLPPSAPAPREGRSLLTIFDNIGSKYPQGRYWCCNGNSIKAPEADPGSPVRWLAAAFTPSSDRTVTQIEIAAAYLKGGNALTLSLAQDASGVPGEVLKSWKIGNMPAFGSCCAVTVQKNKQGISVTGGTQYWIVLTTEHSAVDTWAAWLNSDTDQTVSAPTASYCSSDTGGFCQDNDRWTAASSTPPLAFAVKGF